jgi:hypothetical protein
LPQWPKPSRFKDLRDWSLQVAEPASGVAVIKVEPMLARVLPATGSTPPAVAPVVVGSVVAVEAVRDAATAQLLLQFAGRRWTPKPGGAAADLQPGQRVMARVVRAEPDIELALLGRAGAVAAAMRRELPRQGSPLRLLANLEWLVARPDAMARLPAPVRTALESAWRAVPEARQLTTADGLARAVSASGVRLESLLAGVSPRDAQAALATDWKAALVRLQEALSRNPGTLTRLEPDRAPLPARQGTLSALAPERPSVAQLADPAAMLGELSQQAREALARITCTQLASLDGQDAATYPLLVEVPYRSGEGTDLLRLRIDREPMPGPYGNGTIWTIEFAFDLGRHGPLRGRATLAEGRVSVTLQPESGALAQLLDAHSDELRATLERAGVPVGKLTCSRSDLFDPGRTGCWLVDLRA